MDAYEPHRTRRGQIPVGTPSAINIYSDSTDASTLQMGVTSCRGPGLSSHPKVVQLGVMTLSQGVSRLEKLRVDVIARQRAVVW